MMTEFLRRVRVMLSNTEFFLSPAASKRVLIAKDVMTMLDARQIMAKPGTYLRTEGLYREEYGASELVSPERILRDATTCYVCALGACFVATALRYDKVPNGIIGAMRMGDRVVTDAIHGTMKEYLHGYFTSKQLGMIEAAFEMSAAFCQQRVTSEEERANAGLFYTSLTGGKTYTPCDLGGPTPTARMRAIMKNIVDNGGEFVPPPVSLDEQQKYRLLMNGYLHNWEGPVVLQA